MKILVFNAGSSSLKYKLFDAEMVIKAIDRPVLPEGKSLCKGMVENIGTDNAHFINVNAAGKTFRTVEAKTYDQAMDLVMKALTELPGAPLEELSEVDAIGHRVAHGGDAFNCSVVIDRHVIDVIKQYSELAPLHNPYALRVIERCKQLMPHAMQVAAFDTAFHQTMPRRTYIYPIPYRYYEKYNIRKFGFHGISHKYVSRRAAEFLGEDLRSLKMITCHLGAGASICAIDHGYSMDTSMGYTPLDGIMMNTRSGSVDPAIITAIMEKEHLSPHEMDRIAQPRVGLSGHLRDLGRPARPQGGHPPRRPAGRARLRHLPVLDPPHDRRLRLRARGRGRDCRDSGRRRERCVCPQADLPRPRALRHRDRREPQLRQGQRRTPHLDGPRRREDAR